jgi:hypothetical protein
MYYSRNDYYDAILSDYSARREEAYLDDAIEQSLAEVDNILYDAYYESNNALEASLYSDYVVDLAYENAMYALEDAAADAGPAPKEANWFIKAIRAIGGFFKMLGEKIANAARGVKDWFHAHSKKGKAEAKAKADDLARQKAYADKYDDDDDVGGGEWSPEYYHGRNDGALAQKASDDVRRKEYGLMLYKRGLANGEKAGYSKGMSAGKAAAERDSQAKIDAAYTFGRSDEGRDREKGQATAKLTRAVKALDSTITPEVKRMGEVTRHYSPLVKKFNEKLQISAVGRAIHDDSTEMLGIANQIQNVSDKYKTLASEIKSKISDAIDEYKTALKDARGYDDSITAYVLSDSARTWVTGIDQSLNDLAKIVADNTKLADKVINSAQNRAGNVNSYVPHQWKSVAQSVNDIVTICVGTVNLIKTI